MPLISMGILMRILHQMNLPLVYLGKNNYGYEIWQDALDSRTEYWVLPEYKYTPVVSIPRNKVEDKYMYGDKKVFDVQTPQTD